MKFALLTAALLATLPMTADAGIIQADFREELDLPDYGPKGPRVLQANDRAIVDGPELTEAHQLSNPSGWGDALVVDLEGDILTLTPTLPNSYQIITIEISDMVFDVAGQFLESVTLLSNNALSGATLDYEWTGSSLSISFVVDGGIGSRDSFRMVKGGQTQFQLSFSSQAAPVPEPAALGLLGAGLLGIAGLRRRKR